MQGDLYERYQEHWRERGENYARRQYWRDVLGFLRPYFLKRKPNPYPKPLHTDMLRNYLTIACRSLLRYRLNSVLNLTGLSLGLACSMLMLIHVKEETRYDKGFPDAGQIYRITVENLGLNTRRWAATSPILAVEMEKYIPEVGTVARFHRPYPDRVFSYVPPAGEPKRFEEKRGFYADSTVVDVFGLPFSKGDPRTALGGPDAVVLTQEMARRYFGDEDPLGKTIYDDLEKRPLKITGVLRPFAFPTHLQFDYLLSMATLHKYASKDFFEDRGWAGFYNYVKLNPGVSRAAVEAKLPGFMVAFYEADGEKKDDILKGRRLHLQPVTDIHLHSKLEKEMGPNGDALYVYIFTVAALCILLVAAVNFVNMATAQSFKRMKEVGVRKALGAHKGQLLGQFLGESLLMTGAAAGLAVLLCNFALPFYNDLTAKQLRFGALLTLPNLAGLSTLVAVIGLAAGIYPAWFVSGFNPVHALKGVKSRRGSVALVRKGLVVFQFAVSVFMIFGTVVVYQQMDYFRRKNLGFDKEQLVAVKLYGGMWDHADAMQDELRKHATIAAVARISTLPGDRFSNEMLTPLADPDKATQMRHLWVDEHALSTLQVQMKEGRNFTRRAEGAGPVFILNETAAAALQLANPVGRKVIAGGDTGEVIGIARDFHFASLHNTVDPLVVVLEPWRANYFLLKVKGDDLPGTLRFAETTVTKLSPQSLFSYTFIDDKLNQLYASESRMSDVFKVFAAFAVFISCLGLFGLSAYAAQLRTKEVGIRKVMGASVPAMVLLLARDFLILVGLATVVAWPAAWWVMNRWLEGFANKIAVSGWVFVLSGVLALVVALFTVSFQSVKAALANPVHSLKNE
jgi:putative ABC transport system permease protein